MYIVIPTGLSSDFLQVNPIHMFFCPAAAIFTIVPVPSMVSHRENAFDSLLIFSHVPPVVHHVHMMRV